MGVLGPCLRVNSADRRHVMAVAVLDQLNGTAGAVLPPGQGDRGIRTAGGGSGRSDSVSRHDNSIDLLGCLTPEFPIRLPLHRRPSAECFGDHVAEGVGDGGISFSGGVLVDEGGPG